MLSIAIPSCCVHLSVYIHIPIDLTIRLCIALPIYCGLKMCVCVGQSIWAHMIARVKYVRICVSTEDMCVLFICTYSAYKGKKHLDTQKLPGWLHQVCSETSLHESDRWHLNRSVRNITIFPGVAWSEPMPLNPPALLPMPPRCHLLNRNHRK